MIKKTQQRRIQIPKFMNIAAPVKEIKIPQEPPVGKEQSFWM
jgi:hypothetical protein